VKIVMKVEVSGTRNGQPWPKPGDTVDVDDNEAAQLCAAGLAAPVVDDPVETAVPSTEEVEKRTTSDDLDALREQAEAAGVAVDKRWGVNKLRQEIDAATKAK
jgi:hypothetical protein